MPEFNKKYKMVTSEEIVYAESMEELIATISEGAVVKGLCFYDPSHSRYRPCSRKDVTWLRERLGADKVSTPRKYTAFAENLHFKFSSAHSKDSEHIFDDAQEALMRVCGRYGAKDRKITNIQAIDDLLMMSGVKKTYKVEYHGFASWPKVYAYHDGVRVPGLSLASNNGVEIQRWIDTLKEHGYEEELSEIRKAFREMNEIMQELEYTKKEQSKAIGDFINRLPGKK